MEVKARAGQLLLRAPFGWPYGVNVRFTRDASQKLTADRARAIHARFLFYGCPRKVTDKILSCLRHSGHYECFMASWTAELVRDRGDFKPLGVQTRILTMEDYSIWTVKANDDD